MEFVTNRADNVSPGFQISFITENVAEAYEKPSKKGLLKFHHLNKYHGDK
jgi:hypothetical protein